MKYIRTSFLILTALMLTYCSKSNGGSTETPIVTPTNLTVNATVDPDNNGNVSFTASATNAMTYDYDFGNGIFQTVASGVVTYRYPEGGNYNVNVVAKSKSGKTISKSISVTVTVTLSMIFSDEFDTPGAPNSAKWGYDLGAGGWGNNELQHYTNRPENVVVADGVLKITAKKESFSGSDYTSARLLSRGKFDFTYGTVEVKAKLPTGVGTWPAIWMLGSNFATASWPACGEIDIMEHVGSQQNKIHSTLHYPGHSGGSGVTKSTTIATASTEFHVYKAEWTAASIKFYVDDALFHDFPNNGTIPFNHNFFIILNIAMGGNFGGPVAGGFTSSSMEIDYVRVYQ